MKPTKIDKLLALKAIERAIVDERKALEADCAEELVEDYLRDGTDRRTSPMFGPDAGKFSVKRMKGSEGQKVVQVDIDDYDAFLEWLMLNKSEAIEFAQANYISFARYLLQTAGEVPDGLFVNEVTVDEKPARLTAQVYSFKPELVLSRLGANFLTAANELLLEGESE